MQIPRRLQGTNTLAIVARCVAFILAMYAYAALMYGLGCVIVFVNHLLPW